MFYNSAPTGVEQWKNYEIKTNTNNGNAKGKYTYIIENQNVYDAALQN